ncbi:MAG: hypothetical protein LBL87_02465, partial [Ruminococcus sp.]|nr:hypothetical protein [Ruminococcus sp.]
MIELQFGKTFFRLRFGFFASLALLFLFYEGKTALWSLYACLIHEAGHLFAMYFCGVPVRSVMLYGAGIRIDCKNPRQFLPPFTDFFILSAGPAVNFAVCLYCMLFFENTNLRLFGAVNLVIGLFNLLPLTQFDGGRIISALTRVLCNAEKAEALDNFRRKSDLFVIPAAAIVFFALGNRNITLYVTLAYFMAVH